MMRDTDRFLDRQRWRDAVSVAEAADVLKRYGISRVSGGVGDESDALAHAVAGVVNLLGPQ
jgi:hypothetical protein